MGLYLFKQIGDDLAEKDTIAGLALVADGLESLGFRKRASRIYTFELGKDFLGWLGLNGTSKGGVIEINPVVGVRSQEIESQLSSLLGEKSHGYLPPTVSISLGYLMSRKKYQAWFFDGSSSDASSASDLLWAIREYAISFFERNSSFEALEKLLQRSEFAHNEQAMYRLPLIRLIRGDQAGAMLCCEKYESLLANRTDLASDRYRHFLSAVKNLFK